MAKSSKKRALTVKLERAAGTINMFYVFVDSKKVIQGDGTKDRSWSGNIPANAQVRIKARVTGIANAQYKLTIDLPGTADDQSMDLTLSNGYHEIEITI